ncbi:hypothetical protein [Xanthomonas dyei]|uniref:hypothetical protein n=1 Tax=Xanthomonas dyei TaxID=743699 RepID=UPI001E48E7AA|nr:hypothetical protein [Xanthomonas dyei]
MSDLKKRHAGEHCDQYTAASKPLVRAHALQRRAQTAILLHWINGWFHTLRHYFGLRNALQRVTKMMKFDLFDLLNFGFILKSAQHCFDA